jgi:hypothetical protein
LLAKGSGDLLIAAETSYWCILSARPAALILLMRSFPLRGGRKGEQGCRALIVAHTGTEDAKFASSYRSKLVWVTQTLIRV